jgi:YHS domain-containing protein
MILPFLLLTVQPDIDWDGYIRDFTRDPVALVRDGKDIGGSALITEKREGHRYFFASKANREEFLSNPDRYEIQLGGACGSMGALSGLAQSTKLYAVVGGRLYLFSSEGCRSGFLERHDQMLERDFIPPRPMHSAVVHGEKLAKAAVRWAGGKEAIQGIGPVMSVRNYEVVSGATTYHVSHRQAFNLPGKFADEQAWDDSVFGYIVGGPNIFTKNGKLERPMANQMTRSAERARNSTYLSAINAAARGADVIIGDANTFTVYFDGSQARFVVDDSGKIISIATYVMQGGQFKEVRQEYTGFTEYKGVKVPTGWKAISEGSEKTLSGITWQSAPASVFTAN